MKIRPAAVIIENNRVLLLRYSYGGTTVYQFPGGNIEEAETMEQTLSRELLEELTLPIKVGRLYLSAQVINNKKKQATLHCLFEGKILNASKPTINPEETSAIEVVWMEMNQLAQLNLYPSVGAALVEISKAGTYENNYLGEINQPWF